MSCSLLWVVFILPQEDKPRTTADYDAIVCAELPNSETEPELFKLVARHNIHGPCGEHCVPPNHQPSCCANSNNGHCHRHYPKDFQEETTFVLKMVFQCIASAKTLTIFPIVLVFVKKELLWTIAGLFPTIVF